MNLTEKELIKDKRLELDLPGKKHDGDHLTPKDIEDLNLYRFNMNYSVPDIWDGIDDFTITQTFDPSEDRKILFFEGRFVQSVGENTVIKRNFRAKEKVNI